MTRQAIAVQDLVVTGSYPDLPVSANSANVVWTSNTDQTDRYAMLTDLKTSVWAWNTDSSPHTVTITSVDDPFNRVGDIVYTLAAGGIARLGPFGLVGWDHPAPLQVPAIWIDVSDAKVLLAVLNLP